MRLFKKRRRFTKNQPISRRSVGGASKSGSIPLGYTPSYTTQGRDTMTGKTRLFMEKMDFFYILSFFIF
jgi:hypothetical protein